MGPQLTHPGEFLGSPAYSAPELLRGLDPTPASDRYGFAVTAFELLTGQLPHPGNTVASVISHTLMEPPVFPPGMSGDIAKVFRQALAQDPEERPGTSCPSAGCPPQRKACIRPAPRPPKPSGPSS
jgi:serine/threonine protein kinase